MNIWLQIMLFGLIIQLTGIAVRQTIDQNTGNWMNIIGLFTVMIGIVLHGVTQIA